ncbi:hypothetical protein E1293_26995 [Actinomadura darangshiensis]|uniref:SH3 domain-containing protein n=1 Tax=Actinomadura darangshiensis TaxID=705336 RepID=A0A4V2YU86_9ACTN|nr:hypothetical protein [Actinomadura darangshiensis]TDD76557.1 hypothetical protein E1293_26995 [Actinomadura darangshiensis]
MRKAGKSALTTASLAVSAVIATVAAAATTWTVLPGGAVTATGTQPLTVIDMSTGGAIVCDAMTAKAVAKNGSGLQPAGVAAINGLTFSTPGNPNDWCTGGVGIVFDVQPVGLPWQINAESYEPASGEVVGKAVGVTVKAHGSDECDVTFSGADGQPGWVKVRYNNETGKVWVGASPQEMETDYGTNLVATGVDPDCDPTLVALGDEISLGGEYAVDPKQLVTSP